MGKPPEKNDGNSASAPVGRLAGMPGVPNAAHSSNRSNTSQSSPSSNAYQGQGAADAERRAGQGRRQSPPDPSHDGVPRSGQRRENVAGWLGERSQDQGHDSEINSDRDAESGGIEISPEHQKLLDLDLQISRTRRRRILFAAKVVIAFGVMAGVAKYLNLSMSEYRELARDWGPIELLIWSGLFSFGMMLYMRSVMRK